MIYDLYTILDESDSCFDMQNQKYFTDLKFYVSIKDMSKDFASTSLQKLLINKFGCQTFIEMIRCGRLCLFGYLLRQRSSYRYL
jgi:hypothetical protein